MCWALRREQTWPCPLGDPCVVGNKINRNPGCGCRWGEFTTRAEGRRGGRRNGEEGDGSCCESHKAGHRQGRWRFPPRLCCPSSWVWTEQMQVLWYLGFGQSRGSPGQACSCGSRRRVQAPQAAWRRCLLASQHPNGPRSAVTQPSVGPSPTWISAPWGVLRGLLQGSICLCTQESGTLWLRAVGTRHVGSCWRLAREEESDCCPLHQGSGMWQWVSCSHAQERLLWARAGRSGLPLRNDQGPEANAPSLDNWRLWPQGQGAQPPCGRESPAWQTLLAQGRGEDACPLVSCWGCARGAVQLLSASVQTPGRK